MRAPTGGAWRTRRVSGAKRRRPSTGSPPPHRVLDDDTPPFYRWFPGGALNTCYNALDRHVVAGRATSRR